MESIDTSNHQDENKIQNVEAAKCRVYKKRWLILFLYALYSMSSTIHWIQYPVIADVVIEYYSVSLEAVDWSSMTFSILYITFSIIGSYTLDKLGLRTSILIGAIGTCVGTWMKVLAVDPNKYWLVILSQCVIATFQVVVLPVPQKLAAVWFGPKEVSLACTLGAISIQVGVSLGFIIPPLLVKKGDMETMANGLLWMSYSFAIEATILIIILFFFFDDAPASPPSLAQLQVQENEKISFDYKKSLIKLVKNKSFMCLLIAFGVHIGTSMAISVLLNKIILSHYPTATEHVGVIGLLITSSGIIGATILGVIISKFGRIKLITWIIYISCTISTFLFIFLINQGLIVVYILGVILSTFWNCIFCVAFGLGAELTYPEPEAASGGVLTNFYQLFGVILTYTFTHFYNDISPLAGNLSLVVIILLADALLFFIEFDLKRSAVDDVKNKSNFVL